MADNLTIPGDGAIARADDVDGVLYQIVKLDVGGDGVSVPVTGTTRGLNVDTSASAIVNGRKAVTTAGTALALVASSTPCKEIIVCADLGNTNPVVVGGASVVAASDSQSGIVLVPGNDPVRLALNDVSLLYVDAQTNGDAVTFAYLT